LASKYPKPNDFTEWTEDEYEFRLRQLDIFLKRNIVTRTTYDALKKEYETKLKELRAKKK